MNAAIEAAAARGIKVEPSRDAEYPWQAVVPYGRGKHQHLYVLDKSPERAAAEALAYLRVKGWTPSPAARRAAEVPA